MTMENGKDKRGGDGKSIHCWDIQTEADTHFDYFAEIDGNKSGRRNI